MYTFHIFWPKETSEYHEGTQRVKGYIKQFSIKIFSHDELVHQFRLITPNGVVLYKVQGPVSHRRGDPFQTIPNFEKFHIVSLGSVLEIDD